MRHLLTTLLLGMMICQVRAQVPVTAANAWQIDEHIGTAARTLSPPQANQRRSFERRNSHLSAALQDLLAAQSGTREADALSVRIMHNYGAGTSLAARIRQLGGTIEAMLPGAIYASMPPASIARMAQATGVKLIEPQASFAAQAFAAPNVATNAATGASASDALDKLHREGMRGKGVRVGILDFSFAGYAALVSAGQLPAPIAQRSFATQGDAIADGGAAGEYGHGTECARIIHDIAPDAELVIASVGDGRNTTEGRLLAAARWLDAQGAAIINFSGSGYVSALDGSAALDTMINRMSLRGSNWIVAAGNQAQLHWQGRIADDNRNGWVDTGAAAQRTLGDMFAIEVTRSGPVDITLNWGPWHDAKSAQPSDLDLFVYRATNDGKTVLVAQSDTPQIAGDTRPIENVRPVLDAGIYLIGIRATRLVASAAVHLFVSGAARLMPAVSAGSVGSPGTARQAITVGAWNTEHMRAEGYSGRGPTEDGRSKPELLAAGRAHLVPDNQLGTATDKAFRGTSAAAPVVTGLAALLAAQNKKTDKKAPLRDRLQALARQASRGGAPASQDAAWGLLSPEALLSTVAR